MLRTKNVYVHIIASVLIFFSILFAFGKTVDFVVDHINSEKRQPQNLLSPAEIAAQKAQEERDEYYSKRTNLKSESMYDITSALPFEEKSIPSNGPLKLEYFKHTDIKYIGKVASIKKLDDARWVVKTDMKIFIRINKNVIDLEQGTELYTILTNGKWWVCDILSRNCALQII